jgi:hypothetical protein
VLRARLFQGELHLSFPTEYGFNYQLQSVIGDVSGELGTLGDTVTGDGAWFRSDESANASDGFYRVRVTNGR